MKSLWQSLLLSLIVGGALWVGTPQTVRASEYWDGYWSWYDNTYRPYYYRKYRAVPGPYYGGWNGYYGPGPYYGGAYYGTPRMGYRAYPGGAGAVRVGPLRFGWR